MMCCHYIKFIEIIQFNCCFIVFARLQSHPCYSSQSLQSPPSPKKNITKSFLGRLMWPKTQPLSFICLEKFHQNFSFLSIRFFFREKPEDKQSPLLCKTGHILNATALWWTGWAQMRWNLKLLGEGVCKMSEGGGCVGGRVWWNGQRKGQEGGRVLKVTERERARTSSYWWEKRGGVEWVSLEDGARERAGGRAEEGGVCGLRLLNEEAAEPFLLLSNYTPPCLRLRASESEGGKVLLQDLTGALFAFSYRFL